MQLMVNTAEGNVFPVDVAEDMELENFFALCQAESDALRNVDVGRLVLIHDGKLYDDKKKTLTSIGVKPNDLVGIQIKRPNVHPAAASASSNVFPGLDFSSIRIPSNNRAGTSSTAFGSPPTPGAGEIAQMRQMIMSDPHALSNLRERNPEMARAIETNDLVAFTRMVQEIARARQVEHERRMRILADPLNPEAQKLLEEEIMREHVQENMEIAMEHIPEAFGTVCMLYIKCKVNGHEVKAFVDSGAQTTIMSESCARTCNVTRLIDARFTGIAKGVGTSKIIGRIHLAQLQIGNDFIPTSFTVLEDQGVDMLLGLDMLKRHQCIIDLKNNKLVIGTTGGEAEFLHENELPEYARMHSADGGGSTEDSAENRQLNEAIAKSLNDRAKAAASLPGTSTASGVQAESSPKEADVQQLMTMGFKRNDVVNALKKTKGDSNAAIGLLIAQSLPAPPPAKK